MTDDGEITGGIGNIELHATGASGSVSFANSDNTISTTSGNIVVTAGSGGVNIGNLQTGDASLNPGQITVTTSNGGDVTVESLVITDGLGRAEISVDASDDLTVNGDVEVGSNSAINNVPSGQDAQAIISLSAGDNVVLNGDVTANTYGVNAAAPDGVTESYIGIFGGTNNVGDGDVTINGDLVARAISAINGTSEATVEVRAWNDIIFGPGAAMPVADGDSGQAHVESFESAQQINPDGDVARIIIDTSSLEGFPDSGETHMSSTITGNVLDNDVDSKGNPITATLGSGPSHAASFTLNEDGSYSYTPQAGYVGDDTFTYTATADGDTTAPVLVTITMTNTLPVLSNDAVTTSENTKVGGNVLANDIDADGDPLSADLINGPANADSFTLNPDGSFSYTPADGFIGEDSFTYSAGDPQLGDAIGQATVTITVNEIGTIAPPAAPGVDVRVEPEISGYPALVKWVAVEIGADEKVIDIWFANTLTSVRDITPYEAYAKFKKAANVLQDSKGLHTDALAQLISEFASSTAPPTEEQMASVAEAIARNTEAGNVYARAGQYLDSFAEYVAFLVNEMGFSEADAAKFVTAKYVKRLAEKNNVDVAAFVAARLANLYEDSID